MLKKLSRKISCQGPPNSTDINQAVPIQPSGSDTNQDRFASDTDLYMSHTREQLQRLRDMELFVLDNSMRETTVASLRAHTVECKRAIYEEVKKAGMKYYIVESFNSETRIGDMFLEELIQAKEDLSNAFAFAELWEKLVNKVPQPDISIGLLKCKRFGINNVMIEFDLIYYKIDYETFNMKEVCKYLKDKIDWIRSNLSKDSMIFANLRDFSTCMVHYPERVWYVVNFLSSLPVEERITGIAYEDMGRTVGQHLAAWTKAVRNEMDRCGWQDGHFIFHVHEQWGLVHATNLECLAMGATGIWAGLCVEGAALGHADSTTTIINMIRLGNCKVQKQYNCKYLREAAINITKIATGSLPNPKQPVYGERAIDMLFGFVFSSLEVDPHACDSFDMCEFLGIKREVRISTLASAEMIQMKLNDVFEEDPQFTLDLCENMRSTIITNAAAGRKEEYNSNVGLAMLFEQAGGSLTPAMAEAIEQDRGSMPHIDNLISHIKEEWDLWDGRDSCAGDDRLTFDHFYIGFMAPYFGCYRCEDSQKGLQALDMDNDGMIDWAEFKFFLIWAGRQYPSVKNSRELLDITFRKGLIPAMKDELVKTKKQ